MLRVDRPTSELGYPKKEVLPGLGWIKDPCSLNDSHTRNPLDQDSKAKREQGDNRREWIDHEDEPKNVADITSARPSDPESR